MKRIALFALALAALSCAATPKPRAAPLSAAAPHLGEPSPAPVAEPEQERSPELEFLLAKELELDGKLDEAYVAYQRALTNSPSDAFLLKHLAEIAIALKRPEEARGYAERALVLEPEDRSLRLFIGDLQRRAGNTAQMAALLTTANGDPIDADAAHILYRAWLESESFENARRVARWQVEAEPDSPGGWLNLADVAERQGDAAASERILREADAKNPDALDYLAAIATSRRARGDRIGELGVLAELLARAPQDAASWLAKAEAEFDLGREADGRHSLERAEALQPGDLKTTMRIALMDLQRGEVADAERRFAAAADEYPELYEVAYFLGVARRRLNDEAGALQAFDRIPESHSRFSDGRVQVAGMLEAAGDYGGARAEVERAQSVDAARPLAYYRASLLAKAGDVAGGSAALEALLDGSPEDAEVLYNLGVLQGDARDVDAAIATMQRALAIDPKHAGALNFVGYSWAERGERLDEAQALIEQALEVRPDDGFITDSLGWLFFMRARGLLASGDVGAAKSWLDQARAKLERAHELTGGDPVISEHLGDVYAAQNEKHAALAQYEQALAQSPRAGEQPELEQKLARLRRELGV